MQSLATCSISRLPVHEASGALLLEERERSLGLDAQLHLPGPLRGVASGIGGRDLGFGSPRTLFLQQQQQQRQQQDGGLQLQSMVDDFMNLPEDDIDFGSGDGFQDFESPADLMSASSPSTVAAAATAAGDSGLDPSLYPVPPGFSDSGVRKSKNLFQRSGQDSDPILSGNLGEALEELGDPYAELDPHSEAIGIGPSKPFRRGKTWKDPSSAADDTPQRSLDQGTALPWRMPSLLAAGKIPIRTTAGSGGGQDVWSFPALSLNPLQRVVYSQSAAGSLKVPRNPELLEMFMARRAEAKLLVRRKALEERRARRGRPHPRNGRGGQSRQQQQRQPSAADPNHLSFDVAGLQLGFGGSGGSGGGGGGLMGGTGNQWDDLPDLDFGEEDGGLDAPDSGDVDGLAEAFSGATGGGGFATHDFMDLKDSLPQEDQDNYEMLCRQHVVSSTSSFFFPFLPFRSLFRSLSPSFRLSILFCSR